MTFQRAVTLWLQLAAVSFAVSCIIVMILGGMQFLTAIIGMIFRSPVALVLACGIVIYFYNKSDKSSDEERQ